MKWEPVRNGSVALLEEYLKELNGLPLFRIEKSNMQYVFHFGRPMAYKNSLLKGRRRGAWALSCLDTPRDELPPRGCVVQYVEVMHGLGLKIHWCDRKPWRLMADQADQEGASVWELDGPNNMWIQAVGGPVPSWKCVASNVKLVEVG